MPITPSARSAIDPFHVMDVFEAAEQLQATGVDVLRLEVGQPLTPAPSKVIQRAHQVLDADRLGYTSSQGTVALREAIAGHYDEWYGRPVSAENIVITVGASGGFTLAFLAAFDPGDRVALAIPGYPCYRNALEAVGVEVIPLMTTLEDNFQPTIEHLERAGRIDGLMITSPSNPTGTMLDDDTLADIAQWCDDRGVTLISDEIYHGLTYEGSASTVLDHTSEAIVVNSFSKYFSMTGWRLGWLVLPEPLVVPVVKFASNLLLAPPTLSQEAAVAAFSCHDELRGHIERYERNRTMLVDGLKAAGFDRLAPAQGAFYVYADVSRLTEDSQELCRTWLRELGISATPGTDFDPFNGHRYVRFSFCGATETIERSVGLLAGWARF